MNGKGSKIRKGANLSAYWNNYDSIFRKKDEPVIEEDITDIEKPDIQYSEYMKIVKKDRNNQSTVS